MMLFKLSLRNLKKSFQDYTIYFLTLVLGVAIFYVFNALDSQGVMQAVSASTREIIELMLTMLAGVSVFVSVILGFLIVYANNFLIRKRKKEFGVYMTLGPWEHFPDSSGGDGDYRSDFSGRGSGDRRLCFSAHVHSGGTDV